MTEPRLSFVLWRVAPALFALCLGACSPAGSAGRSSVRGAEPGSRCAPDESTRACTCSDLDDAPGRQVCLMGAWGACECVSTAGGAGGPGGGPLTGSVGDPAANKSDVRFDWKRTPRTGGSCEAGHYEGTFSGLYGPAIIVVADLKVIPVFPLPIPGNPGLAFDLERDGSGETFTVKNGKMSGNALGAFPFTADIEGTLDCETLEFDAMLVNGSYFIGPLEYRFEGPITATYNKQTHTLVDGKWKVTEPDYPTAGGQGDWTVSWVP